MTAEKLTSILDSLLSLPAETEVVEFKRAERNFDDRDLGQYFSALSNEANLKEKDCAWLIFGIENKSHEVVGSQYKNSRPALDAIKKKIADQTTGRHTFVEIYELLYRNGKRVVMFQIPPAPQGIPIAFQDHYYGRDGESLQGLAIEKITHTLPSQIEGLERGNHRKCLFGRPGSGSHCQGERVIHKSP